MTRIPVDLKHIIPCLLSTALICVSCHKKDNKEHIIDEARKDSVLAVKRRTGEPIETMILNERTFNRELAGNGKVMAKHSAELHFGTAEPIAHIWVKNGDRVRAGQKLAQLDLFRLEHTWHKQRTTSNRANWNYKISSSDVATL